MNRAFYIVGIVFAVIFSGVISYYAEEVDDARWSSFNRYSYSSYGDYDYGYSSLDYLYNDDDEELTTEAGLWSIFFILSFITIDLMGLLKVKTKTVKVLSIIGLSLSGIWLLWTFAMLASPGGISFDEVQPGWSFYATVMLAFSIVGLVQAVRFHKRQSAGVAAPASASNPTAEVSEEKDLLDI